MKAHEITEPGFYWNVNRSQRQTDTIVEASRRYDPNNKQLIFWHIGSDVESYVNEISGDFIGPIVKPNAQAAS